MNMLRVFLSSLMTLFFQIAIAQNTDNEKIQCIGETIPPGWAIVGRATDIHCPKTPFLLNNAFRIVRLSSRTGSINVCPGSQFQGEWVVTRIFYSGMCDNNALGAADTLRIAKLDQIDSIDACSGQPLPPPGWLVGKTRKNNLCGSSIGVEGYSSNIYKIASKPMEFDICYHQRLPSNLVITSSGFYSVECEKNNAWKVVNLDKYSETELNICDGQTIPPGWEIFAKDTSYACAEKSHISIRRTGVSCTLQTNSSRISSGGILTYNISGVNLPPDSKGYWYGTRNGIVDVSNYPIGRIPTSQSYINTPGAEGNYTRYVQIRSAQGKNICTTQPVQVTLEPPPTCGLSVSANSVPRGGSFTYYSYGSNLPADAAGYWYGTRNGAVDSIGGYAGGVPFASTYTNIADGSYAGTYTRYLEIRSGSKIICRTNSVTLHLY